MTQEQSVLISLDRRMAAGNSTFAICEVTCFYDTFVVSFTLQILEDLYENVATLIVSSLPVGKGHSYLDEPMIADAILDRIVPKAHRVELKGDSLLEPSKSLS